MANLLATQFQVRQNNEEARSFVEDLFKWEKEVKQGTRKGRGTRAGKQDAQEPAIRGRAGGAGVPSAPSDLQQPALQPGKPHAPARQPAAAEKPAQHPAAHTYKNYGKWDRMDVDALLAASEDEAEGAPSSSSSRRASGAAAAPAKPGAPPTPRTAADVTPLPPDQAPRPAGSAAVPGPLKPAAAGAPTSAGGPQAAGAAGTASAAAGGSGSEPAAAADEPATPQAWRERGNDLFKTAHYEQASICYDRSIALAPTSQSLGNRAAAALKLGRPADAESDCTAALALEPAYVKAYHRRGAARTVLGKHLEAASDYEMALRYDPASKALAADRDRALQAHLAAAGLAGQQPRVQRLPVVCVPAAPPAAPASAAAAAPAPPGAVTEAAPEPPTSPQRAADASTTPAGPEVVAAQSSAPAVASQPACAAQPAAEAAGEAGAGTAAAAAAPLPLAPPAAAAGNLPAPPARAPSPVAAAAVARVASSQQKLLPGKMQPPRNSVEFEAAWRSFLGDRQLQAAYLQRLDPESVGRVFKSSLTAGVLAAMATAALAAVAEGDGQAAAHLEAPRAVALLAALPGVPRFGMAVMCLTRQQRAGLGAAWEAAAAALAARAPGGGRDLQQALQQARAGWGL